MLYDLEKLRAIDEEFNSILYDCFRGLMLSGNSQSGPVFRANLHEDNRAYIQTDYFLNTEKTTKYFHLTSVSNLLSILNSRTFRLYNLHTSNDVEEYGHVAKMIEIDEQRIKAIKHHLYTFSFCPLSEINNQKVWDIYGNKLGGVAIVFTIDNNPADWKRFHISTVKYETPQNFIEFKSRMQALKIKYPYYQFDCDLSPLICFHKESKWKEEKEIRIAAYKPYKHFEEELKYSKPDIRLEKDRNRIVSYVELPIWVDNSSSNLRNDQFPELDRTQNLPSSFFETHPKLIIREIIFGQNCGIHPNEFDTYRRMIREIFDINYGYSIDMDYDLFQINS